MKRTLPTEAEIGVLEALAAQKEVLAASTAAGAPPLHARLRYVDPGRQFLVLESSGDATAGAALLAQPRVELQVEWGVWRVAFAADQPEAVVHEGAQAIRVLFPASVSISRRRMLKRATVRAEAKLRCVIYSGAAVVFDAAVTDVSEGGVGMQLDSAGDTLRPGVILAGCRLERPGRKPVAVDLEVRHTAASTLADGRRSVQVGCQFAGASPEALELVAEYVGG